MPIATISPMSDTTPATPTPRGPILVACDGEPASAEALFTAARVARQALGGAVEVLGVCEPTPAIAAGAEIVVAPLEFETLRRETLSEDIRRVVSISAEGDPTWPLSVVIGSPARTLAATARDRHAALLVMGIGRHNPMDRLFGAETTLATLRESSVPVLAVGAHFPAQPTHAVVGMDFGAASIEAARLAMQLVGPRGHLTLVHVRPRFEHPSADWQAWDVEYGRTLPPLFDRIRTTLAPPATLTFDTSVVRGDPAPALLAVAQQAHADLVAIGTQHHTLLERLMVGSVATSVLRTARGAVLAVPTP